VFRYAGYYFAGVLALAVLAFAKSYVVQPTSFGEPYTHVHAALMVAWFGILIAQPFLIRRERRAAHRLLGRISFVLVARVPRDALAVLDRERPRHDEQQRHPERQEEELRFAAECSDRVNARVREQQDRHRT
jgi:hypothetical protein